MLHVVHITDGWNIVKEKRNQRTENSRSNWKLFSGWSQRTFVEGLRCLQRCSERLQGTMWPNILYDEVHVRIQPREVYVSISTFNARHQRMKSNHFLQCTFRFFCWNFFINKMLMKISFLSVKNMKGETCTIETNIRALITLFAFYQREIWEARNI